MPRRRIIVEGIVQGVGFRPFVHLLARQLALAGWVRNDSRGVTLELEGEAGRLDAFEQRLRHDHPPLASLTRVTVEALPEEGGAGFAILASDPGQAREAQVAPDADVCPDCLRELFDPGDRRYRYPFINCTNCGPRYTLITDIPYDRPNTTMTGFALCAACRAEYEDPADRRYHAQPVACPACGPRLALLDRAGQPLEEDDPLSAAVRRLRAGEIVALKGLGGYHLAVDPRNAAAVSELRRRKGRDEKPFALMARDLAMVRSLCEVAEGEARLLASREHPIVLLRQRNGHGLAPAVAPRNRCFGMMLPYTPLHHLLLAEMEVLVMTSANLSDEPMAFRDGEALAQLSGIADAFLVHDRPIQVRADDSIARLLAGEPLLLRRSRGYAPRAVLLPEAQPPTLALGAELKNTICLVKQDRAFLSQHIGDLKNAATSDALRETVAHLSRLLAIRPEIVVHDLHPDYLSTRVALEFDGVERVAVQHHHAHLAGTLADNGVSGPAIGVIFDGLGYGENGELWGGEFLVGDARACLRAGHFAPLCLPGGDAAAREPRRMALSALYHAYGEELPELPVLAAFSAAERKLLLQMLGKGLNAPPASSCGRLFDAVAALAGLRMVSSYEGQAALELEMALDESVTDAYPFELVTRAGRVVFDPATLIRAVVADVQGGVAVGTISARFHNGLAALVQMVCDALRHHHGLCEVALSGGVFQNRVLTERVTALLEADDFTVWRHRQVPPNDGGISLGQAVVAGALLR